jgi:hypothetical protein
MRRLALILASACALAAGCGAGSVWAQSDAAPDPVKVDLARQLVEATGGEKQADDQMELIFNIIERNVDQAANGLDSRLSAAFLEGLKQETVKLTPQLMALSERLYAQNCTEQELRDMLAFEKSATGQSMLRKTPAIQAQALAQTLPLVMDAMPDIVRRAADHACAQAQCTPQDRQRLTGVLSDSPAQTPPGAGTDTPPAPPASATPRPQTPT